MHLAFARGSNGGAVPAQSRERTLNMFAEPFPDAGEGRLMLLPSSGLAPYCTGLGGPVRALYTQDGMTYAAAGGTLWEIDDAGAKTALGVIGDSPYTTLTGNGFDVAAAVGDTFAVWDGAALSFPSSGAFSDVGSVAAAAGYVILGEETGQRFSITSLNDAATVEALDFASAEARPDPLVTAISDHRELWLLGTRTVEVWTNSGAADFPWAPLLGSGFETGLAWRNAVTTADRGVWFVGHDRVVYRATSGGGLQRVSTARVETALAAVSGGADVRVFAFRDQGHQMIAVRLPGAAAWVFDLNTGLWHERGTGEDGGEWTATCSLIRDDGAEIIGGSDGALHRLEGLTDSGRTILREMVSMPVVRGGKLFTVARVDLRFAQGLTYLDRAPVAMVETERDHRGWSHERQVTLGAQGEGWWVSRLNGLGRARSFSMRVRITDPICAPLVGVDLELR